MAESSREPSLLSDDPRGARDRVLDAAAQLFQERGFEGASMTLIARAARTTAPNLYTHFASKHALLREVLETMYQTFYNEMADCIAEGPPDEQLDSMVRSYVLMQLRDSGEERVFSYRVLIASLDDEAQRQTARVQREYLVLVRGILRRGVEDGLFVIDDVKMTAFVIISACEYVFTWYRSNGDLTPHDVADYYVAQVRRLVGR
jgi:AcrR family transcriptional regulator